MTKVEIRKKVVEAIAFMSGYDASDIREDHSLEINLGLTKYQKKALATPFQKIARECNGEATITRTACVQLKTVKVSIALVLKASGLKSE